MLKYSILKVDQNLVGEIALSPTKSINKRVLVFRVIKQTGSEQKSLPVQEELKKITAKIPAAKSSLVKGDPGKALRHLRAFFNFFKGDWIISGSGETKNRPIEAIVKILQKEGVNIRFAERMGPPPFKLTGINFKGNTILRVDSSVSSTVINATLMLSPNLPNSMVQEMKDKILTSSYIELTLKALQFLGVNYEWNISETLVESEFKDGSEMAVEADWTAASYWYEIAALSTKSSLTINGLTEDSVQYDSIVKELFEPFGVKTSFSQQGMVLTKGKCKVKSFEFDFSNNLDLVPTFAVTCVMLKIPFRFKGIKDLHLKYNDRIKSLQSELKKFGATITIEASDDNEILCFDGKIKKTATKPIEISTFEDHRMAMAFAPIAITGIPVIIENPKLASTSYPSFWDDFKKTGFTVEQEQ